MLHIAEPPMRSHMRQSLLLHLHMRLIRAVLLVLQLKSVEGYEPGQQLNVEEIFKIGDKVDVAGTTNGKGFQGEVSKL